MIAFSLFGISIYWYGIFYFIAFLFGYLFFLLLKKYPYLRDYSPKFYDLIVKSPEDIVLYSMLGVLVGGRLGHILIYDMSYYLSHPLDIFALWKGGMSFIGGILGVVFSLALFVYTHSFSFRDFLMLTDFLIPPTGLGIMFGRIGNFLNQELYGRLVTDVFPGISSALISFFSNFHIFAIYDHIDPFLRVNTNFISSFFEGFLVFAVGLWVLFISFTKKRRNIGFLSSFFLMWYSFVRFFMEYLRMDSQSEYIGFFTKSQLFFVLFFVFGLYLLVISFQKKQSI